VSAVRTYVIPTSEASPLLPAVCGCFAVVALNAKYKARIPIPLLGIVSYTVKSSVAEVNERINRVGFCLSQVIIVLSLRQVKSRTMRRWIVFILSLVLFQKSLAETGKSTNGVISLSARNFDLAISDGNPWLIEFYAPWCG